MSLAPGARLGPYEITAQIGVGGMGEVYRATDRKLGRDVAIKVLPASVAQDPERLARFDREARTLASLNHPNIAAIYGLEDADGIKALVMELVEGPTLADRIAQGAIPVEEALPIAKQIGEALEAAHEQGIIHRDLKPANIKVRPDGTVKVLDFGLAKAMEPAGAMSPSVSQSPTITTPAMTQMGVILGTAAYMSPEQAKGRPADKRSDVWAFGAVLYEMLTGSRAFDGEDMVDVLGAVTRLEPDWNGLPANLPAPIRTLVQACLVKDRRQRIADISAALFVLRHQAVLVPSAAPAPTWSSHEAQPRWKRAVPIGAAAVLGAALAAGGVVRFTDPAPASQTVARFSFELGEGESFTTRQREFLAVSPDGTQLAYIASNQLFLRPVADVAARSILGNMLEGGLLAFPAFAPDGQSIAFVSLLDNSIKRMPVTGGTPVTLASTPGITGLAWGDSGIIASLPDGDVWRIVRVSPSGGTPETLVTGVAGEVLYAPQILPGGTHILFSSAMSADDLDASDVLAQSLSAGERTTLLENAGGGARYVSTGHLVYAIGGTLFAVAFDADALETNGAPAPVIEGVWRGVSGPNGVRPMQFAVSTTGTVLYVPGPAGPLSDASRAFLLTRGGVTRALPIPPGSYVHPRVSRDGRQLAFGSDIAGKADIWVYDLGSTAAPRRLTFAGNGRFPIWSGDGRFVTFQSDHEGDRAIFRQRADGAGTAERLTKADTGTEHVPEAWSPDGAHLLYRVVEDQKHSLFVLTPGGAAGAFGGVQSAEPTGATFSPDGRWVAYASSDIAGGTTSPNRGIFVQPYPATGARYQVPKTFLDFHPAWAPDGSSLYYVAGAGRPTVQVTVQTQPGAAFGTPVALDGVPLPGVLSGGVRGYDVLPDGGFVTATDAGAIAGDRPQLRVILNWTEELKRLVP